MTTLPRTTPPATPEDPRLTAYTSGDLPHTEAAHFVTETAHDPAVHDDVARTHEFIAALEDALASEPLPKIDPPIFVPSPAVQLGSIAQPKRSPRRFSLFPSLATALASAACLILIGALLIPTVGRVRESSQRSVASSNIRQVGQASLIYASDNGDKFPDAANLHVYAGQLAAGGGLNDASIWLAGADIRQLYQKQALPLSTVTEHGFSSNSFKPGQPTPLDSAFQSIGPSFAVPLNGITATMPSTTPIAWTRGLQPDGTWAAHSPWGTNGGHIVFLGGNVIWLKDLRAPDRQLTRYDGKGTTSDIREALPPDTRIGEYIPTPDEQIAWGKENKNLRITSDKSRANEVLPLIAIGLVTAGLFASIYLWMRGRIRAIDMLGALLLCFILFAVLIPMAGRVR